MFLYELAIELDMRSTELATDAARLGLAGLSPTSELTQEQAAALRTACRRAPVEPIVATVTSGPALAAPAGWGTQGVTAQAAAPPPPPPPPPPVASMPERPSADLADPSASEPGALPPPPQPPSAGPPAPWVASGGPGPIGGPSVAVDEDRSWREAPGRIAAVAAVVVLVIGLFVFMTVQSGRNDDRRHRLAAVAPTTTNSRGAVFDKVGEPVPPNTGGDGFAGSTSPLASSNGGDVGVPVDTVRFCAAATSFGTFSRQFWSYDESGNWQAEKQYAAEVRATWEGTMEDMARTGPSVLQGPIATIKVQMEAAFDHVAKATPQAPPVALDQVIDMDQLAGGSRPVSHAIDVLCP